MVYSECPYKLSFNDLVLIQLMRAEVSEHQ